MNKHFNECVETQIQLYKKENMYVEKVLVKPSTRISLTNGCSIGNGLFVDEVVDKGILFCFSF
jgi:hypothetical protein